MQNDELQTYQGSLVKVTPQNGAPYCYVGKVQEITPEHVVLFPATTEERDLGEKALRRLQGVFRTDGWTDDTVFQNAFDDGQHRVKRADIASIDRLVL